MFKYLLRQFSQSVTMWSYPASTTHVAFLPSSVKRPNSGTKPVIEPKSSNMPELRLQRAPKTEFAYTTAEDSAHESTSPRFGILPT